MAKFYSNLINILLLLLLQLNVSGAAVITSITDSQHIKETNLLFQLLCTVLYSIFTLVQLLILYGIQRLCFEATIRNSLRSTQPQFKICRICSSFGFSAFIMKLIFYRYSGTVLTNLCVFWWRQTPMVCDGIATCTCIAIKIINPWILAI